MQVRKSLKVFGVVLVVGGLLAVTVWGPRSIWNTLRMLVSASPTVIQYLMPNRQRFLISGRVVDEDGNSVPKVLVYVREMRRPAFNLNVMEPDEYQERFVQLQNDQFQIESSGYQRVYVHVGAMGFEQWRMLYKAGGTHANGIIVLRRERPITPSSVPATRASESTSEPAFWPVEK